MSKKKYEWVWNEGPKEWSLNLFPNGEKAVYYPRKLSKVLGIKKEIDAPLPFIGRHKNQTTASHLIRLEKFEPTVKDMWYYGNKPQYQGKVDSTFLLIYEDWLDWEYRSEAYFLDGRFKTGRMPTKGGKYTEDLTEFKKDLTNYFEQVKDPELPKFGGYMGKLFTNSNLPKEYIVAFEDLII